MRAMFVTVLIAVLMFAAVFEEALLFAVGRHLFAARPAPEANVALASSVRDAELAERRACGPRDLFDPPTSCEAR